MMSRRAVRPPRWKGEPVQAILLDLDGTLLDTVEDITVALNRATAEQQLATLTTAHVRDLIGRGVPTLIAPAPESTTHLEYPWPSSLSANYSITPQNMTMVSLHSM
jgi:phosphoglycolate phosphatase-like HAD superfamily hydrolase